MHRSTHRKIVCLPLLCLLLITGCDNRAQLVEAGILRFGTIIDPSLIHKDLIKTEQTLGDIEKQRVDLAATTLMIDGLENSPSPSRSPGTKDYLIASEDREIIISRSLAGKIDMIVDWPVRIID